MEVHFKRAGSAIRRVLSVAVMAATMALAHATDLSAQSNAETERLVSCMVNDTTDWDRDQLYPIFFSDNPTERQTNTVGLIVIQKMLGCGITVGDVEKNPDYFVEVSQQYGIQLALDWLESASK